MASMMNGMSLHGGLIPFGGTFLIFADYSRPALRLGAIQQVRVIHEFTHDSFFLGEDGPTHQPIEHAMALRAIPNFYVFRPGDAKETAACFEKALQLVKNFPQDATLLQGCGFADIPLYAYDLIINATAASLQQQALPLDIRLVGSHSCCYDLMYANQPTPFMQWAQEQHASTVVDGLGMLVEQAAESFYLWRGIRPDTDTVYQQLRPLNTT
jgi:hypothetical protein